MTAAHPVPVPDALSAPFWEAGARGELALPRCSVCSTATLPADQVCPNCHSTEPDWRFEVVPARGHICSWTVVRQAFLPGVEVPFTLVDVELAAATEVRLIGRLVGPDEHVALGEEVVIEFEQVAPEIGIPVFRMAALG